ncbi:hypothetical protein FITA111629_07520 [Filibacter tadaridae]|uniref:Uncharacterized protein n=1 Tax=Filibacter tadaridae TaxID=2483811 RepID=A0A3P5X1H4_9BACL|nr:hypothetical protein [Filibacter tadaridae]VDC28158.1 hypothetical protein FILTAD_01778 [Filibacter tadaridae]
MSIKEKVKDIITGAGIGYFDTGICGEYARYDLYMDDKDKEVRRNALMAFTMMLGTWHSGSSFSFTPQHLRKFDGGFGEWRRHELHHYMKAFVTHQQAIQRDFPVMYAFIVWFFIHIEDERTLTYEESFPELDTEWCTRLRQEVLQPNAAIERPSMKSFFIESGIEPFFISDFPGEKN